MKFDYNNILDTEKIHVIQENFSPIFFLKEYPTMATGEYTPTELNDYKYINGLKSADIQFFLPDNINKYLKTKENFEKNGGIYRYAADIDEIIKSDVPIIISSIPSSKMEKINVISQVADYLSDSYPDRYVNGNALFQKENNEIAAHEAAGRTHRNYKTHYDSWKRDVSLVGNKDSVILVLDDVVTSGSSFYAGFKHLKNLGYNNIVFLAFGKTTPNIRLRGPYADKEYKQNDEIDAIIFDVDQTIIKSDKYQEIYFETNNNQKDIWRAINDRNSNDFKVYDKIEELFDYVRDIKKIPVIFVTNRDSYTVKLFFEVNSKEIFGFNFKRPVDITKEPNTIYIKLHNSNQQEIATLYKNGNLTTNKLKEYVNIKTMECLLAASDADVEHDVKKIKPSDNLIRKAIEKIELLCEKKDLRIVGIGNSEYDIIAYNKAGIESVLVHWGNKVKVENTFKADREFNTVEELMAFLRKN